MKKTAVICCFVCIITLISSFIWFWQNEHRQESSSFLRLSVFAGRYTYIFDINSERILSVSRRDITVIKSDAILAGIENPYERPLSVLEFDDLIELANNLNDELDKLGFNTLHQPHYLFDGGISFKIYYDGRVFETHSSSLTGNRDDWIRRVESWGEEYDGDFSEIILFNQFIYKIINLSPMPLSVYPSWLFENLTTTIAD